MKTLGFILIVAIFWLPGSATADLLAPTGLNPGEQYRIVFVSSTQIDGVSGALSVYNAHVTNAANSGTETSKLAAATWTAIASVAAVSARSNTGTTGSAAIPIYLVDGTTKVADGYDDFWDATLAAPINLDESGNAIAVNSFVWTGTATDGSQFFGNELGGAAAPRIGNWAASDSDWISAGTGGHSVLRSVYGLSSVLTVTAAVPEPHSSAVVAAALIAICFGGRLLGNSHLRWSRQANGN
ncbi:MAG: hypothetical protein KDA85_01350 [Planctomycetaceae bacterium]|nr:hypothetical protein [Planctomycetaceae bacterium]